MRQLFKIDESEKKRILEMHETATRKNYLSEAPEANKQPVTKGCGVDTTGPNYSEAASFAGGDFCPAVNNTSTPWGILGKFLYYRLDRNDASNKYGATMIYFFTFRPYGPTFELEFNLVDSTTVKGSPVWKFANNNFKAEYVNGSTSGIEWGSDRAKDYVERLNNLIVGSPDPRFPPPGKELMAQYITNFIKKYTVDKKSLTTGPMVNSFTKVGNLSSYPDAKIVADAIMPQSQTQQATQPTQPQTGRQ